MTSTSRTLTIVLGASVVLAAACGSSDTTSAPGLGSTTIETSTTTDPASTLPPEATLPETTAPAVTTLPPDSTPPPATDPPATDPPADSTTTTTTTTLPPPPAPCGVFAAIPGGALEVNTATLDALGDGTADDVVTTYRDPGASEWRMRLDLPTGSTSEIVVPGIGAGFLKILGAAQVDNGGADEFLAVAGSGASAFLIGAFGADSDGCLFRFTQDGGTFVAPVGATVTHQDGLSCTGAGLSLGHAENTTGTMWEVSSTSLSRVSMTDLSATASSIAIVDEADVGNIAVLSCPGLSL